MTENENKLIDIIRSHANPVEALNVALCVITAHLTQHGSFEGQEPADPREPS